MASQSTARTRVMDAIARQGELELSKDEILAALREGGMIDLDALATRLFETLRDRSDGKARPMTPTDWRFLSKIDSDSNVEVVHRPPTAPFFVDGVQYRPEEIRRFDGRPLTFVLTVARTGEPVLVGYSDFQPVLTYLQAQSIGSQLGISTYKTKWCTGYSVDPVTGYYTTYQYPCGIETEDPPTPPPPPPPPPPSFIATFHEHLHVTSGKPAGHSFSLDPNTVYMDLTKVHKSGAWPFDSDWNDAISAITLNGTTVMIAEHTNLEGTKVLIGPNLGNLIDLASIGWNDRISSVWNVGPL